MHCHSEIDLEQLRPFIRHDTLESLSGSAKFNIAFAGKIKDLPRINAQNLYKVKASGKVELEDVRFKLKNNPLEFSRFDGELTLLDNDVEVHALKGSISSSDVKLSGVFHNFITFLLIPNQPAMIQASCSSNRLDLDELLANKRSGSASDTSYLLQISPRLIADLDVVVNRLHFRKFDAENLHGRIRLEHQVISGTGLAFSTMKGNAIMDATIDASHKDGILMSCDAKLKQIDINLMFSELENFDQSTMTDKNVKGKVSADVQFTSSWSTGLEINPAKVVAHADITVEEGELNNFRPILALAKYMKIPDLNHIRFSTLHNTISIANRKINLPLMEIKSSALNLTGSGIHDFENNVDYHLRLLLSDVLGKKAKSSITEFGEVEDDGLGRTQLFISMKGPVDNPKFAYDRTGAKEKLKTDIAHEKENMKSILHQEFGLYKKDPPVSSVTAKKKEEMQVDWNEQ